MTEATKSTVSPHALSEELDNQALKYKDFTSGALQGAAGSHTFEKVCNTATDEMTLYFIGAPDVCTLKVARYATDSNAEAKGRANAKERNFTWDHDAGKWREVANDFKNDELADKLRDWLVSNVE